MQNRQCSWGLCTICINASIAQYQPACRCAANREQELSNLQRRKYPNSFPRYWESPHRRNYNETEQRFDQKVIT
jgi:hypothetical protein